MPILREYRDGVISFNTATFRLEREAFIASPAALLKFVDDLGAYSTGYTVARNAVRNHVESVARGGEDPWVVLATGRGWAADERASREGATSLRERLVRDPRRVSQKGSWSRERSASQFIGGWIRMMGKYRKSTKRRVYMHWQK